MENNKYKKKEWINAIKERIAQTGCKAMLLSGASAAGKTFMSEEFAKNLEKEGKKVFIFSTDNFYKGITRNILDKAEKNFYNGNIGENKNKIIEIVREHTIDLKFQEKYNDENLEILKQKLKGIADDKLADYLKLEFERINFDEPAAVDLNMATEFLNTLILEPSKYVCLPEYSFLTGEYKLLEKNNVKGEDYDFFIMEGIFSLNDKVINNLKIDTVKSFVECSLNTLLIRKLNRDITKGRSSMTKETIILTYLETIIPAYFTYILPTRKNADFICLNAYNSFKETKNIFTSSQEKYHFNIEKSQELEDRLNEFELLKRSSQVDYFFSFKKDYNIISLREEDKKLIALNYKSNLKSDGVENRTSESFNLKNELSEKYTDAKDFSQLFIKAGYDFTTTVRKIRSIYCFGDIYFRYDSVKELGEFIEFVGGNASQIDYVKKRLNLTKSKQEYKSYYTLMNESQNIKRDIKLKIFALPKNTKNLTPKKMVQWYLNTNNDYCNFILKSSCGNEFLNDMTEAKITLDDEKYILTVKCGSNTNRTKIEKEIADSLAESLIKEFAIKNPITKYSYKILENEHCKIDIDKYDLIDKDNKRLILCCLYSDNMNRKEALDYILDNVDISEYIDVTEHLEYKNRNLSRMKILKKY